VFCRTTTTDAEHCESEFVIEAFNVDPDEVMLETRCLDCAFPERRDWYRKYQQRVLWTGFDEIDGTGAVTRSVRWGEPPVVYSSPIQRRDVFETPAHSSSDGTMITGWRSRYIGNESPVRAISASVLPIQVVFSDSKIVQIEYTIESPGSLPQHRVERWWLYPGVGTIRREARITEDGAERLEIDAYTPPISILSD
jgi:hypothetical protein